MRVSQTPYLCPIDLAKVSKATSKTERERFEALLRYCSDRQHVQTFAAFAAWIRKRLELDDGDGERRICHS